MSFSLKQLFCSILIGLFLSIGLPASAQTTAFCNPLNIDYAYCQIPNFVKNGKHRATADPAIVLFRNNYYLFSTNQFGYWWSDDMLHWHFVARPFLKPYHHVFDDLCAPAPFVMNDALFVFGSTTKLDFPIWKSTNPKVDDWTEAIGAFQVAAWDPDFFCDEDGRLYLYYGSSNKYPIYGQEIDAKSFQPIGDRKDLINLHEDLHGWERFGEHNDNVFLKPFIEGSWMTKHDGKYYLQYGAPGTEFSGYGDGVYVGEHPLGPFVYQEHNPFSYKPGGFARGAGHGATFQDTFGKWWHVSTIVVSVKNNYERRIGIWPAGFDKDGVLYCDTAYGDYPLYLPERKSDHAAGCFTGWMLLNYNKPVTVSSTCGAFAANNAVDENIKTYWCAASSDKGEWLQSDLGMNCTVHAIQINYADQDAEVMGRQPGLFHQYVIHSSQDGKDWQVLVDKSKNRTDVPHDFVELPAPVIARFIKIENVHVPTGKFALSGLRVFGSGSGRRPDPVQNLVALRGDSERRNVWLKWKVEDNATGYTIRCGVAPDKLYNSIMIYDSSEYYWSGMDKDKPYYFQIEAFNENGISDRSAITQAK
jgi:xylan 1,4-beta-xylosidase